MVQAYSGLKDFAFLSYSHKDSAYVNSFLEVLTSIGCRVWYDEGIIPSDEWADSVAKKISQCMVFIVIISKNSIESKHVKREIYYAISKDIPIIAFYKEEVELPQGLDMQLGMSQAILAFKNVKAIPPPINI